MVFLVAVNFFVADLARLILMKKRMKLDVVVVVVVVVKQLRRHSRGYVVASYISKYRDPFVQIP